MHASEKPITRRDFLRGAAYVGLAGAMGLPMSVEQEGKPNKKVRVVLVRDAKALNDGSRPNADVIQRMLDDAVTTLLDERDPVKAWKLLIKPTDIVGIKSNAWHYMPTPKELERAIQRRVMDAGVPEENIAIDDRGVLSNPIFIQSTALINTRPVRTHFWAGIGGCIKNYIMFAPEPSDYHPDSCADLAMVWYLPIVKGKTRLNVLSLLRPLFHGRGVITTIRNTSGTTKVCWWEPTQWLWTRLPCVSSRQNAWNISERIDAWRPCRHILPSPTPNIS